CRIWGPTLPVSDYSATDLGDGNYSIVFDTLNHTLYQTTLGEPIFTYIPYTLNVVLQSQNRSAEEISLRIRIIRIPTELISPGYNPLILQEGHALILELQYRDLWHDTPISNATVSVNISDSSVLRFLTVLNESETGPGFYNLVFGADKQGSTTVIITVEKDYHERFIGTWIFEVEPYSGWPPPSPSPGLVIFIIIIVATIIYSRRNSKVAVESDTLIQ
ncbi:MAG: hypothetical protein ACFFBL_04325, partial [Promethearchaeota archaeon]